MLVSQKLAIAAHLHVLLRRKTGRVTDTEWMAANLEYALEIIRFTRAKAAEDGHPDLVEWADKLERAVLEPSPVQRTPLAQTAVQLLRERSQNAHAAAAPAPAPVADPNSTSGFGASTFSDTGFADSVLEPGKTPKPRDPSVPRYVGGIR
ncbi:MAG: hypothetical protein JWQ07_1074 [Ramlibacter sp.]|nr:hypothetical protein [Ramlibacter sp.]